MGRRKHRGALAVPPEEFDALVQRALDGLPEEYARLMKNVAVVVEEEPSREILDELGIASEDDLLGLYSGAPIDGESFFSPGGQMPNRISIYRGPILRLCRSSNEVVDEVRDTIIHEIGHHFGLSDEEMPF